MDLPVSCRCEESGGSLLEFHAPNRAEVLQGVEEGPCLKVPYSGAAVQTPGDDDMVIEGYRFDPPLFGESSAKKRWHTKQG